MTETMQERIERNRANARAALDVYHAREGADEYGVDLYDLLADLLHLADGLAEGEQPWPGFDGEEALRSAVASYRAERDADPDADPATITGTAEQDTTTAAVRAIEEHRAHYQRRHERETTLADADRRDSYEQADYADGVRAGLDLALSILQRITTP